jgi:ribosome-binding factor A
VSRRTERIGEQIRAEVARLLREEVTDPRIGLVTIVRVDVAPDLSNARVFWSLVGGADDGGALDPTARGLASASPFLRKRLSRALTTKRVPELRFEHDPSLADGSDLLGLMAELAREREARAGASDPEGGDAPAPTTPGTEAEEEGDHGA